MAGRNSCWCALLVLLIAFRDTVALSRLPSSGQVQNSTGGDEHEHRNNRVLIGILSQPSDPAGRDESYIAASYVKFVESAGARVVPFLHDMSKREIKRRYMTSTLFAAASAICSYYVCIYI